LNLYLKFIIVFRFSLLIEHFLFSDKYKYWDWLLTALQRLIGFTQPNLVGIVQIWGME